MRGRALLALLVVVLVAIPVLAQVTPIPEERVGRIIEALLIWRLVDEPDLTAQQIARLFPRIKQLKDPRTREFELRQARAQRPPDQETIKIKVAQLQSLPVRSEHLLHRILRQINGIL